MWEIQEKTRIKFCYHAFRAGGRPKKWFCDWNKTKRDLITQVFYLEGRWLSGSVPEEWFHLGVALYPTLSQAYTIHMSHKVQGNREYIVSKHKQETLWGCLVVNSTIWFSSIMAAGVNLVLQWQKIGHRRLVYALTLYISQMFAF